ncbi:hypothetical protein D5086_014476 [Populus alba]|uniref:Fe2OG dioxygenase domain-containing protein n=2 Tax=Populus alba TaxID=43335 RepID=A0A4U5PXX9_POPAL|nr:protein DMR6-LIKE OXYGENASE 1-like [Populus alba]TKS02370.1 hypothetical protein D5086_0000166290 [Populus alba]
MMYSNEVLSSLLISDVKDVPSNNINPIFDLPKLSELDASDDSIPLIDLDGLNGPNRSLIINQIGQACEEYGFFMVKNHGIPEATMNNIQSTAMKFFKLPNDERLKFQSIDPTKTIRLTSGFNNKNQKVFVRRESLKFHSYPIEDYEHEWPSNPPSFKEDVANYGTSVRGLEFALLEAISESLGLERDYIDKTLSMHGQGIAFNYYPPYPQPELTFRLSGHTDPTIITILLIDDVPGLQVLKNGKWVNIRPIPNTFVVNVGDQIQVLSNDRYKSVPHRVVVNCDKERISIPSFYYSSPDTEIGPAKDLIDHDHPAIYRKSTCGAFNERLWNGGLAAAKAAKSQPDVSSPAA